ncbi:carboxypeptidase M32 [Pararhodobacter zhoushanensis]|uniref:Metal-dependent carboxypeptidase n=1 Tax=Pararhodobacter zhoushanensis TaxID=2479545 RepID=A0ABT3H076_9RHOB|nr:carboxypeptidase M32 [Pararhodobacter zhoushanensis]MCW1933183.1 carboxypeptidase M32 [Pararhodobacter zhoushanensis]
MSAFDNIAAHERTSWSLAQVMGRLGWDQETVMPRGAAEQRGEEMAALEEVLHARRTDPQLGEWLAEAVAPDAKGEALLRHVRRSYGRNTRVPARLASELARVTSVAQSTWAEARAKDDVAHFLPTLARVIALKREEAAALAQNGDLYDALLADYEPGITGDEIGAMFARMRPRLVALREKVLGAAYQPKPLTGSFGREGQLRLSTRLAQIYGYDFAHGRIDMAVHPFSSGSGGDVRITTRVAETDPFNCLYSTIHEVGHACYEQSIDPDYRYSPLGEGVSMGVHESQSRIYENQLGRSKALTGWLHDQMSAEFGDLGMDPTAFYGAVNRVQPGYIRTESDEVQYNLHIMMRFDLERALIAGDLSPGDLETAWNDRFLADFGVAVDRPSNGMLQDVHWSVGLFGYFPTYSLGNVYAGCLMKALRADLPDIDAALAAGQPTVATAWLREKLQQHGGLREPRDTITQACGFEPDEGPLLDYLEAKFGAIYGV